MLTQGEADALMTMRKRFTELRAIAMDPWVDSTHELVSDDEQEQFLLDIWRGTFRLSKLRLQERARKVIVLVRLDIDGSPHTNPDGVHLGGTHLHTYREGYEDKWAEPIDRAVFTNPADPEVAFRQFCGFCNIAQAPPVQGSLL